MRIGTLRDKVELQEPETEQSTSGEESIVWRGVGYEWAEVKALSGKELEQAMQIKPEINHSVKIRYKSNALASWRVKFGDRLLGIEAVIHDQRRTMTALMCKEIAEDA